MLWKLSEKSIWVFLLFFGYLTFISTQFWNFPISEWDIGDLKNIGFLGNFANFTPKSKLKFRKLVQIVALGYSNSRNTKKIFLASRHYIKSNKKKFWQTKLPISLNPTIVASQRKRKISLCLEFQIGSKRYMKPKATNSTKSNKSSNILLSDYFSMNFLLFCEKNKILLFTFFSPKNYNEQFSWILVLEK